jgi:hypothetical protein
MNTGNARRPQQRVEAVIRTLAAGALVLVSASALGESLGRRDAIPPYTIVGIRDAGVRDLRGEFRAAVCARLPSDGPACENVLLRLAGESAATALPPVENLAERFRIAFVPGLFSECFEAFARPFADAQADLQSKGFAVDYFQVAGRGSSARNAQQLAEHFRIASNDARPIIIFAYSKGLVDLLEFMVQFPEHARQIAAVVAVAGASNGSPLADQMHAVYRAVGASFPLPGCAPGTGEELIDLQPDARIAWWQRHGESITVPLFALVAAPEPDRVSPATRASYRQLAKVDVRNDGKLLWQDQIPPRSYLLGYVNADHWSIAVPVAAGIPQAAFLFRDDTPRAALIGGALDVVARTLADSAAGGS